MKANTRVSDLPARYGGEEFIVLLPETDARGALAYAEKIRALGRYADVLNVYMEEPPLVADWLNLTRTPNVVVVPFFISDGLHSYEDIPALLGLEETASRSETGQAHQVNGRSLFYSTAIGTDPKLADVIIEQATGFDPKRQVPQSPS